MIKIIKKKNSLIKKTLKISISLNTIFYNNVFKK